MKRLSLAYRLLSLILTVSLLSLAFPVARVDAANLNHNYPRLANYFLKPTLSQDRINSLKKWDVLVLSSELGYDSASGLNSIRSQNPNVVLLPYVDSMLVTKRGSYGWDKRYNYLKLQAVEGSGSPGWWLHDQYGNQVSSWVNSWNANLSDVSPVYGGKRWAEYLADLVSSEISKDYPWDGIFYDEVHEVISWLNNGNLDLNNDRVRDSSSYVNEHWSSGLRTLISRSRANEGPAKLIIGNGGYTQYAYGNGRLFENFPKFWSGATWDGTMQEYFAWQSRGLSPQLVIINGTNGNSGDQFSNLRNMRFTLASTLLGDGYFSYDYGDTSHGQLWWYDEYSVDANGNATGDDTGKGYLGQPKGAAQRLSNGIWRRDFDRGIVLCNPTSQTQTVTLEKTYQKIRGTQAPDVNDGSYVNSVTIPSQDGIILLDPSQAGSPSPSPSAGDGTSGTAPAPSPSGGGSSKEPRKTGHIHGRVVSAGGQTILGTAVRAGGTVVPTNPGGEFRISNLAAGVYTVYYDAPGYMSQTQESVPIYENQTTDTPMVIMSWSGVSGASATGEIFGKIVNGAGKTIPGTCIRIDTSLVPANRTGEFRFTLVHPAVYTVYYDAPGYKGQTQMVQVRPGATTVPPKVIMSR